MSTDRFKEKVVVVTGATSGIGAATARRFSAEGARVALIDRDRTNLETVAKELPPDRTTHLVVDVSDSAAVEAMVSAIVSHFGGLDVMINNVGVHEGGAPDKVTDDQWRKVMSTDVDGVFFGCRRPFRI